MKCDDRTSPLYGGNKPRKLEFLIGEALRRGRRSVMTFGGIGTNHGLATTICARRAGLRTILVLVPQPLNDHVRHNLLLDHAYGAELHLAPSVAGAAGAAFGLHLRGLARGDWPYMIPTGGTCGLGAIGYVNAALELAEQVRAGELPEPDCVFVPVGSGGTHAGLVAGFRIAGLRSRVIGVLVTNILPPSPRRLAAVARGALRRLRRCGADLSGVDVFARDFTVLTQHVGARYGAATEEAVEAQGLMAQVEGVQLETTYSAKCMAGLLRAAGDDACRGRNLLFWNTYSSVDPANDLGELPDFRALPEAFHPFFPPVRA